VRLFDQRLCRRVLAGRVQSRRFRPLCGILMPNSVIVQLSVQSLNILGV